ncbi:MAG: topoisomerase DNA-binding C4 zinc finger domain-containing protein [Phycisphaerae bacterium]|nr:topoisomerase DNA-binding C4 zinc finger domain-containing protein [Phycisphaerae bacterium]
MTKGASQTRKAASRSDTSGSAGSGGDGAKALVIVESPAKAKTINKYLGRGYVVKACKGHVRDLPPRRYGIDPGRNFEPTYEILSGREKVVEELKKAAAKAPLIYLATDLDREGEAIAWHLTYALSLPPEKIRRVVFNEITRSAVAEAFAHPREIDTAKVDAQQARRILDRVVGYELSPLLWKKVAKGLSAGRVQSVAVRMIVGREDEIRAFEPQESWAVEGVFTPSAEQAAELAKALSTISHQQSAKDRAAWVEKSGCIEASLVQVSGRPFKPEGQSGTSGPQSARRISGNQGTDTPGAPEGQDAGAVASFFSAVDAVRPVVESMGFRVTKVVSRDWEQYAHLGLKQIELVGETSVSQAPEFRIKSIDTKRSISRPSAPFTTATLQQAAANQLRFGTSKTMKIAQSLYEGIDIQTGEGNVGLITYMRTDSTNLSAESIDAVRDLIRETCGDRYLPPKPNRYGSAKKAQEAHEAIRPTDVRRTPTAIKGHMTPDQHKLYTLVWNRFVACQMSPAEWDATTVLISAEIQHKCDACATDQQADPSAPGGAARAETRGSSFSTGEVVFKAMGRVLVFDGFYKVLGVPANGDKPMLPALEVGQRVAPVAIEPKQRFTSPPPRYTEASLVKAMEAEGIGRPSTYAAIIKTIQDRGYVEQAERRFHPTARGQIVTQKLVAHFPRVMDVRFTNHIEDELDKIAERHLDWHEVLHEFYDPFKVALARAHQEMEGVRAEPSDYTCETCGRPMVYRFGRNGRFLSCTGYPECQVARNVDQDGKIIEPIEITEPCDVCGKRMVLRRSRLGPFLGCSGYPECTGTKPCTEGGVPLKKVKPEEITQACHECGAPMQVKFSRGRSFLGCSKYPKCKATCPLPEGVYVEKPKPKMAGARCDKCGRPMVIRASRRGPFLSCSGFPKCRNAMPMDKLEHLKKLEAAGEIPDVPPETPNGRGPRNGNGLSNGNGRPRGKAERLTAEEIAALGPPPPGFAWTRTGRPVVETWPEGPLTCFDCGGEMTIRTGRFGPFFSCVHCKATANLRGEAKKRGAEEMPAPERAKPIETDVSCPECGSKMLLRMGRTGRFLGCSAYPSCKATMEAPPGLLREVAEAATP